MHPIIATMVFALALLTPVPLLADIPATPVMTLYQFRGALDTPYYTIESFEKRGPISPAGALAQGSSIIPCLVIRNGRPLTDSSGTPYVGFEVVVDSRTAKPPSSETFKQTVEERSRMRVPNHHCDGHVKHVMSVQRMFGLEKPPFFGYQGSPEYAAVRTGGARSTLDEIVRAFHHSSLCDDVNTKLIGRRDALANAWERFIAANAKRWSREELERAKHLDYTMRTAIYEGHLDRGCNAYGACERNIVALSIRNRARGLCTAAQGCRFAGDFRGVSSSISQYNIWDEFLTQISGLTACFLNSHAGRDNNKIRVMYEQNIGDVERILFGNDEDLTAIFPKTALGDLKTMRHYYHAPAMRKCFPTHPRVEYMSGAVASKGTNYALIANMRVEVGTKVGGGYLFREFNVRYDEDRDVVTLLDSYPGFVVDGRKVSLTRSSGCPPYGIPPGCPFKQIGRYRRTPPWLRAGRSLAVHCAINDRGESCLGPGRTHKVTVGDACDTQMRPVTGVR